MEIMVRGEMRMQMERRDKVRERDRKWKKEVINDFDVESDKLNGHD